MSSYAITCCSTADLSNERFEQIDVQYACFHFEMDGVHYSDNLGKSISFPDFYDRMANGAMTKTAQVNISEYLDLFCPILETGKDILHITLSSGISGTINSARNAALIAAEKYPERKIFVVDSLGASSGFGYLVERLAEARDSGMTIEECRDYAESLKLKVNHWFFSTDLSFYVRGGRISKAAGLVGSVLGICPLLNMDEKGCLIPRSKIRSKKRVIREIVDRMEAYADDGPDYSGPCNISHSNCYEDARAVADLVEERFPKLRGRVQIYYVGTTIGSHTGPGTVALFFTGRDRSLPLL